MALVVKKNEVYTFRQSVFFETHQYGSDNGIPSGQIIIQRGDTQEYWDGASYVSTPTFLATTIDPIDGLYHEYSFTFPNANDVFFNISMRVNNDPQTETKIYAITREFTSGGGGSATRVFDGVDFATGFPSTVGT